MEKELDLYIEENTPFAIAEVKNLIRTIGSNLRDLHASSEQFDCTYKSILVSSDGSARIVRTLSELKAQLKPGEVSAEPDFFPPEYFESGSYDNRGDVFILGAIAYELLTAKSPFVGENVTETMRAMKRETAIPTPMSLIKECSEALSLMIMKALEPEPHNRFQSMDEMLEALEVSA